MICLFRFISLIGTEFYPDLLRALKAIAVMEKMPDLLSGISILITVFKIVNLKSESSFFDLKHFYIYLYGMLEKFKEYDLKHVDEENIKAIMTCFDLLFFKLSSNGAIPFERVAAFVIRIALILKHRENFYKEEPSPYLLNILWSFFKKYSKLEYLFDSEQVCGKGVYSEKAVDPDYSNSTCMKLADIIDAQSKTFEQVFAQFTIRAKSKN